MDWRETKTEDEAKKVRARDCLRDGWMLWRKNVWVILLFVVLMFLAGWIRLWLLHKIETSFGGGYALQPQSVGEVLGQFNGAMQYIPPAFPWNVALLLCNLLTQFAVALLAFCGRVWVTAASLCVLGYGEGLPSVHEMIRPHTGRLIKLWFFFELLALSPSCLWGLLTLIPAEPLAGFPSALLQVLATGMTVLSFLVQVLTLVLSMVLQYAVCHILCGDGADTVFQSLRMTRRTGGTLVKAYLIYEGIYIVSEVALRVLKMIHYAIIGFPNPIPALLVFFWVTVQTALFCRVRQGTPAEEEQGDDFEPSLLQEIAAAEAVGERFHFRVSPSLRFDEVGDFHCGLARVIKTGGLGAGKWGYVDADGREIIPFIYQTAADFSDGLAAVGKGRCEYYIGREGETKIAASYDRADMFREGLALVKTGPDWAFVTPDGVARQLPYRDVYAFNEGRAVAYDGGQWVYIDASMQPVLRTEYDDVWSFYDGLAMVEKGGKLGFIDRAGREIVPPRYVGAQSFSGGLAAVAVIEEGELCWGYIDQSGREIIPPGFERAGAFCEGRAAVGVGGKYGHIDRTGRFITPPEYQTAGPFSGGFAVVEDVAFGYVDAEGVECTAPVYLDARPFSEGRAWVKTMEGWGILEQSGYDGSR